MNRRFSRMVIVGFAIGLVSVAEAAYTETYLNDIAVKDGTGKIVALGISSCTSGCGLDCAFDDDPATRVDPAWAYQVNGKSWVGLELTEPKYVTKVVFSSYNVASRDRIKGAEIQGANTADFSDAETLLTLTYPSGWQAGENLLTQKCNQVSILKKWKYLRLYTENPCAGEHASSVNTQCGNVNILRFYGGDAPDAAPATPTVSLFAQVNWRATFKLDLTESAWFYEFERKGLGESDFSTYVNWFSRQDLAGQYVTGPTYAPFDSVFRVRATNPAGSSDWVTLSVPGHYALRGTLIGTAGNYPGGAGKEATVDGDPTTYFDSPNAMRDWAGLDFGSAKTVTGIRYVPRIGVEQRMPGNEFQISETADFAVTTCVYRVATRPPTGLSEVTLDTPVSTRYMRVHSLNTDGGGGHCNVAEFEFTADPEPCAPPVPLSIARQDLTNQYPVITWDYQGDWPPYALTTCVWRTMSPGGVPLCVGVVPVGQTCYTDTTARVGVEYTYQLSSLIVTNGIPAIGELSEATDAYRRSRRLERTWEDQTKLASGCTKIKTAGSEYTKMDNLFDGDLATFADMVDNPNADTGNVRAGVDFGEPCTFTSFRIYPKDWTGNAGGQNRVKNYRVWGSADDSDVAKYSWTNAYEMTEKLTYQLAWTELAATNQGPYRFAFLWKPEGTGFMNLAEFECYGWRTSDLADAPYPAENVAFSSRASGVRITWTPRTGCTYRIERRPAAGGAYETVATTDAGEWLDRTATLNAVYAYRLVTIANGDDESATADTEVTWVRHGIAISIH